MLRVSKRQICLDSRAHGEYGVLAEECDEDSDVARYELFRHFRGRMCVSSKNRSEAAPVNKKLKEDIQEKNATGVWVGQLRELLLTPLVIYI